MNEHGKPESFRISDYDETIRLVLDSGGEFCMYPRGKSMLPLIVPERDCVTLVKCHDLRRGDIALSVIVHRINHNGTSFLSLQYTESSHITVIHCIIGVGHFERVHK